MKRSREAKNLSRRKFLGGGLGARAALSLGSRLPTYAAAGHGPQIAGNDAVIFHVPWPAGPPALGSPAEVSVPCPRERLRHPEKLAVLTPSGEPCAAQKRRRASSTLIET